MKTKLTEITLAAGNMVFAILLLTNFVLAQNRAYIGIGFEDASPTGVRVISYDKNSPAEKSGIAWNDIIISVKGNAIKDGNDLRKVFALLSIGENVEFEILRNGKNIKISMNIAIHPHEEDTNKMLKESIEKITELLKANKLEECIKECGMEISQDGFEMTGLENVILNLGRPRTQLGKFGEDSLKEKYYDLCEKQLVDKIRKLPRNKINTPALAGIYYDKYYRLYAKIFQNDGKMILGTGALGNTVMIQLSKPIIGNCMLTHNEYIPFTGYVKPLGNKTYSSLLGKQTVPNYQLLFCESGD